MAKAKKLSPTEFNAAAREMLAEAPVVGPSLADRIRATCAEAQAYIESKVDELKASPDASSLPRDWLMMNTRALNGGHCHCKVALSLLEKET